MITPLDSADLDALVERARDLSDKDRADIECVVAEVQVRRKLSTHEARRDVMMMAAAIASELAPHYDVSKAELRTHVATTAVQLAFEIERVTPK